MCKRINHFLFRQDFIVNADHIFSVEREERKRSKLFSQRKKKEKKWLQKNSCIACKAQNAKKNKTYSKTSKPRRQEKSQEDEGDVSCIIKEKKSMRCKDEKVNRGCRPLYVFFDTRFYLFILCTLFISLSPSCPCLFSLGGDEVTKAPPPPLPPWTPRLLQQLLAFHRRKEEGKGCQLASSTSRRIHAWHVLLGLCATFFFDIYVLTVLTKFKLGKLRIRKDKKNKKTCHVSRWKICHMPLAEDWQHWTTRWG